MTNLITTDPLFLAFCVITLTLATYLPIHGTRWLDDLAPALPNHRLRLTIITWAWLLPAIALSAGVVVIGPTLADHLALTGNTRKYAIWSLLAIGYFSVRILHFSALNRFFGRRLRGFAMAQRLKITVDHRLGPETSE